MSEIKLTEQSFHIHLDFPEAEPETKFKAASFLGGGGNPNSLLGSGNRAGRQPAKGYVICGQLKFNPGGELWEAI